MWLGDQITVKGFGNGISILIFVNIISQLPNTAKTLAVGKQSGEIGIIEIALFLVFVAALLFIAVFFSLAERRIPVQYAGKAVGNKVARASNYSYTIKHNWISSNSNNICYVSYDVSTNNSYNFSESRMGKLDNWK